VKTVGVVGCGLMGSGIAQVCAEAGYDVVVREVTDELLKKGLGKIEAFLKKGVDKGKLQPQRPQEVMSRLHGTTELRVPLLRFNYLLPWSIGAIGFFEAGRVWDDGESPGTWHSAKGIGGWIGLLSSKYSIQLLSTDRPERRFIIGTGLAF